MHITPFYLELQTVELTLTPTTEDLLVTTLNGKLEKDV